MYTQHLICSILRFYYPLQLANGTQQNADNLHVFCAILVKIAPVGSDAQLNKVSQSDAVFGLLLALVSKSLHAMWQLSISSGYNLPHPD